MGRALTRRVYALAVAYLSQWCMVFCGLVFPFMANRFWKYEAVLYSFLFGLSFIAFPVHRLTVSFRRTILCGAVTGYVSAVLSLLFTPLLEGERFHNLFRGWSIFSMADVMIPVETLCWLIGICFGLALLVQERRLAREVQAVGQRI